MSGIDCSSTGTENYIYDTTAEGVFCPTYSPFFGVMGASAAMVFSGAFACGSRVRLVSVCLQCIRTEECKENHGG